MHKQYARPAIGFVMLLAASTAWAQTVEVAAAINVGLEGPTADASGNVYFTDGGNNRILKMSTDGKVSTFRQPSNRACRSAGVFTFILATNAAPRYAGL
jgi:sugar lactone lactonase YvrE